MMVVKRASEKMVRGASEPCSCQRGYRLIWFQTVTITTEDDEPKPWTGLDLSSQSWLLDLELSVLNACLVDQGLCAFGTGLFTMPYITHLYLANNDIDRLPSAVQQRVTVPKRSDL